MKHKSAQDDWSTEPPTEPGLYLFKCDEGGNEPSVVRVYWFTYKPKPRDPRPSLLEAGLGAMGFTIVDVTPEVTELWVECPDVGKNPLQVYHDNLCNPRWKKKT